LSSVLGSKSSSEFSFSLWGLTLASELEQLPSEKKGYRKRFLSIA
jgi:hypothetical protein